MSLETKSLEFDNFRLDAEERILLRDEKPVQITPKALLLLFVLIENRGRIVSKESLMQKVWADSFVEDSNLTFTISILRKALAPGKFIETVPKRGYRFIADVKDADANYEQVESKGGKRNDLETNDSAAASRRKRKNYNFLFAAFAALLLVAITTTGWWYSKNDNGGFPVLEAPFGSEKLSTNGKVFHAVTTPDGKNVIYTNFSVDKQSVWMRQLETANNIEIIPPSNEVYAGLAVSPDGNFLYFVRRPHGDIKSTALYRVPIFGGVPIKLIDDPQGWIGISPDGAKISFVRCKYLQEENCALWIADALDGKNERKIISRPKPLRIGDNEFAPDGKTIAFAVGQSENQANGFGLEEVDLESGAERELTTEKFFNVNNLTWLPDKSGLLVTASRIPNKNFRIWRVTPASDEAVPLTNDAENYSGVSLDNAARILVSTQVKDDFHLSVYQMAHPTIKRTLVSASHSAFTSEGKIVISSSMSGTDEIWIMNADGSSQRQLTNNTADDSTPVAAPDGSVIFFSSNRSGAAHVWRMNEDGSDQTQITQIEGGFPLHVSPDGQWVYYRSAVQKTLWRTSTHGDLEELVLDQKSYFFAFSPDGSQIAFSVKEGVERVIRIVSIADKQTNRTFRVVDSTAYIGHLIWSRDGKSLLYRLADGESKNNTLWRQSLDAEAPQKITDLGDDLIESVALAPDGKSFSVVQGSWKLDAVLLSGLR